MVYHGFPWQANDFDRLEPFAGYRSGELTHNYRWPGIGVPLIAVRQPPCRSGHACRLVPERQPFAATAVLRFEDRPVLELFDPLRTSRVEWAGYEGPVARDLTAPLAFSLHRDVRSNVAGLFQTGFNDGDARLYMIEPYQPGKVPVIFVHGLASDPSTWYDLANELRARPQLQSRYQIWAFKYSTGEAFLKSAARLRAECRNIVAQLDPEGRDPALHQIVLVGHSMGGLVCKLQVTASDNTLWNAVAGRPLESIRATEPQRAELAETFFFEPLPCVRRVVFMATPHRGSSWARQAVGRISSAMVSVPEEIQQQHDELARNNPGVFSEEMQRRVPTSIDLLEPDSPLLRSMLCLRVAPQVQVHSLIANGELMWRDGPGDGVVPVSSALHPNEASRRMVPTTHSGLHHHPEAVEELVNILRRHVAELDAAAAANTLAHTDPQSP